MKYSRLYFNAKQREQTLFFSGGTNSKIANFINFVKIYFYLPLLLFPFFITIELIVIANFIKTLCHRQ